MFSRENKESMIRAVNGEKATIPQTWYSCAVPGVETAYQNLDRALVPTTREMVEEATIQTRAKPVDCKSSRHGADKASKYL